MNATQKIAPSSIHPKCSDPVLGYGIGNCAGCNCSPIVLYKSPCEKKWRCESCFESDYGTTPANLVTT